MTSERIRQFLESIKPEGVYNNFLKDKRVAIVGPSKHILLENNGDKIDDYDVVIRLKWLPMKGFNHFKDTVGDETHVVYSSAKNIQSDFECYNTPESYTPDIQNVLSEPYQKTQHTTVY